ncbi:HEAT repeat domain-containing protein [Microseira wollei]|uniref:PBS lyase HEAT-like repeat domain protein n=1 Tax=Microseira wollei NIES-4236 TaxID=2530354 RepID=A0AAV3XAD5_9CYAN|nr:HEAT repeat domain-containing protein [Microseira wollei]GET37650.1 PBS lyase HEAT-like repeat domain protein [Microseira wollei NIES-4236]
MWLRYLNDKEPIPRGNAILNLTSLLDKEIAVNLARQALNEPHYYVRGHAINSLVRLIGKEAIPLAIRALDDPHPDVRGYASGALISLKQYLPNNFKLTDETVDRLLRVLTEAQDTYDRSKTVETIINLCSIQPSLLLHEGLEITFLNASYDLAPYLRSEIARGLKIFKSEKAAIRLLQMIGDSLSIVALSATESLKNLPYLITAKYLPDLRKLISTSTESFALDAILAIQNRCQFYNYELFQSPPVPEGCRHPHDASASVYIESVKEITLISDQPPIFNQYNRRIGVNYAAKDSNPKIIQNVHNTHQSSPEAALDALVQVILALEKKHTHVQDEQQALCIIDAEFKESKAKQLPQWQDLINVKRLYNGGKKATLKVGEHFAEENVWGKAFVAFLEGASEDVK